jgi:hypothetical protein
LTTPVVVRLSSEPSREFVAPLLIFQDPVRSPGMGKDGAPGIFGAWRNSS